MTILSCCRREGLTVRKAILLVLAFGVYNLVMLNTGQKREKELMSSAISNCSLENDSLNGPDYRNITDTSMKNVTSPGIRTYKFKMRKGNKEKKNNETQTKKDRKKNFLVGKVVVLDDVWTEEKMAEQEKIFDDRILDLATSCLELEGNSTLTRNISAVHANIRWVPKHNLIWCPVYKAASTTWMGNLLLLAGMESASNSFHKQVKKLYPPPKDLEERERLLNSSMRMLIVRHPLERLLSAYRDKMLRDNQFLKVSQTVKENFPDPSAKEDDPHPTFLQFLLYIKSVMRKFWNSEGTSRVNPHWQPVWWTCGPCQIKYDAIAHMETLTADQEYIIRKAGLKDLAVNAHTHSSNIDSYGGTEKATRDYYSKIPKKLIQEISHLYSEDFKLFGYSPEEFIDMGTGQI